MSDMKIIDTGVNCYLIRAGTGFILIDTGFSNKRAALDKALESAGCKPGGLKLIILTHGDIDHAGNAAYLRKKLGAKIAMHKDDSGMVERSDMSWNRKARPDRLALWFRIVTKVFGNSSDFEAFKPDIYVDDAQGLSEYGLDAKILGLPGHSRGSVGVLTDDGDIFCGDLLINFFKPGLHPYIDDLAAANDSVEKLKKLNIKMIYPGHGKPFPINKIKS